MSLSRKLDRARQLGQFAASYLTARADVDFLHRAHPCSDLIGRGDYPIDFRHKTEYPGPFNDGIPFLDLGTVPSARSREVVYSPIMVSQWTLGWFSRFLHGEGSSARLSFLRGAESLREKGRDETRGGRRVLVLPVNFGRGRFTVSGMAQGLAISAWCRAHDLTGDESYLTASLHAAALMSLPLADGGTLDTSLGIPVLEEFADEPIHILNGHLFGVIGLLDLAGALEKPGHPSASDLRAEAQATLRASVQLADQCDMRFWTRYSRRRGWPPNIASNFYQNLHCEMMAGLRELTGIEDFGRLETKWRKQLDSTLYRLAALALKTIDFAYTYHATGRRS